MVTSIMKSCRRFSLDYVDGTALLRLLDSELLEREVFAELLHDLTELAEQGQPVLVVISFEYVRRLSSEMIAVLLRVRKVLARHGGRLYLCEMRKEIREIFRVLRLDFLIWDTVNEALDAA